MMTIEHVTTVVSAIGEKGVPAEQVAEALAAAVQDYIASTAPVGPHLADQWLIPLVMGGGRYRTSTLTAHAHTNAAVIERMPGACISVEVAEDGWVLAAASDGPPTR